MNIVIYAGGRQWLVDDVALLNWLSQNATQPNPTTRTLSLQRERMNQNDPNIQILTEKRT
jgi:hypothetical protein